MSRKISGLTRKQLSPRNNRNWLSIAEIASEQGCSTATLRKWCQEGLIPEAHRTAGGHWRVKRPLSLKTKVELAKRRGDPLFSGPLGSVKGEWEHNFAEWLLLAQLYQQDVQEDLPIPTIPELHEPMWEGNVPADERQRAAKRIQQEILDRIKKGEPFSDLLLLGWVYQFWLEHKHMPTIAGIADFMGLSRAAWYRRYKNKTALYNAYLTATGVAGVALASDQRGSGTRRSVSKSEKPQFWRPSSRKR